MVKKAKKAIKVGIWGLGRAGLNMHCPEMALYPDEFEVVAGCDIDPEHLKVLKKKHPKAKTYSDGEKFLADPNVELVAVAVRSTQHVDYAIRALKAGKYVFCEKPVALTSKAMEKLGRASEKFPGKLFLRHNRRFEACFNHVMEIIHSGILGEVYEIKLCRHCYQFRDDWQSITECGGGQLNNWGPHIVDHALQLMEAPVQSVWSDLKCVAALGDAEDHLKIVMRGENKRVIDIEISGGITLPSPVYAVYGTRGSLISMNESEIQLKYLKKTFKTPPRVAHTENPPIDGGFGGTCAPQWVEKTIKTAPANKHTVNDIYHLLYQSIRENAEFPIKFQEALQVVKMTEQVKLQNPDFKIKKDIFGK